MYYAAFFYHDVQLISFDTIKSNVTESGLSIPASDKKWCKLADRDLLASFIRLEVALTSVSSGLRNIITLPSPCRHPQNKSK